MATMRTAHTADLDPADLREIRRMLDDAFSGHFEDTDWEHALGGMHALVREDGRLIAHGSVVQRRLLHRGRAIRTGYVEGVAVAADRRGRGHAAAVMTELERVIRHGYDLGALSAAEGAADFYLPRGWRLWQGPTYVLAPEGLRRTPEDDDSTMVLPLGAEPPLEPTEPLACDWRDGDVW